MLSKQRLAETIQAILEALIQEENIAFAIRITTSLSDITITNIDAKEQRDVSSQS